LRDTSIVDILWGLGFVIIAWISYSFALPSSVTHLVLAGFTIWGTRLAYHISTRNWGKGDDFRYSGIPMLEKNIRAELIG